MAVPAAAGPSEPPQGRGAAGPGPEPPKPDSGRRKESWGAAALPGVPVSRGGGAASAAASHPQGQSAAGPPRGARQPARPRRLRGTAAKPARAPHRPPPGRQSLGLLLPPAALRTAERSSRRLLPPVPPRRGRAAARRISEERQQQQEGEGQPQEQAVRHQLLRPGHPQPPPGRAHPPAAPAPCAPTLGQPRQEGGGGRGPRSRPEGREAALGCRPAGRGEAAAAPQPARGGSSPGSRGWGRPPSLVPPSGCNAGRAARCGRAGSRHRSAYGEPAPQSQNILKRAKTTKTPTGLEGAGGGGSSSSPGVSPLHAAQRSAVAAGGGIVSRLKGSSSWT